MHQIIVSVENAQIILDFYVQKRRTHGMQVMRDIICVGRHEHGRETTMYIPAVTYQSVKDNYDRMRGIEEALSKFMKHNAMNSYLRTVIWKGFRTLRAEYEAEQALKQKRKEIRRQSQKAPTSMREAAEMFAGQSEPNIPRPVRVVLEGEANLENIKGS